MLFVQHSTEVQNVEEMFVDLRKAPFLHSSVLARTYLKICALKNFLCIMLDVGHIPKFTAIFAAFWTELKVDRVGWLQFFADYDVFNIMCELESHAFGIFCDKTNDRAR